MNYSIIAAIADNLVIGTQNSIPWHNKEDLNLFKKLTTGNIIIMGRKTFDSIGRPLPNRTTIVVTSTPDLFMTKHSSETLFSAASFEQALEYAEEIKVKDKIQGPDGSKKIFIAGGASIYKHAIKDAERLYLSRIPGTFNGDTFFPEFRNDVWELESVEELKTFKLEVYRKK